MKTLLSAGSAPQEFPQRLAEYPQAFSVHVDAVDVAHSMPEVNGRKWCVEVGRSFRDLEQGSRPQLTGV
jgi:hypothetical protein